MLCPEQRNQPRQPPTKLRTVTPAHGAPPAPEEEKKGIVYQLPCKDCDGVYTGESKRTLKVRLTEHKRAVVKSDVNNSIAVHVAKNEHSID